MIPAITVVVHANDLAATILGTLGVGLSLVALGWQARSFYLAGSRVSIEVRGGFLNSAGELMTAPWAPKTHEITVANAQGFTDPVFTVEVTNSGRSPTSVTDVRLLFPDGGSVANSRYDPALPFRLDAESEQTWVLPMRLVAAYVNVAQGGTPPKGWDYVRGQVWVARRKKPIVSRNQIGLA